MRWSTSVRRARDERAVRASVQPLERRVLLSAGELDLTFGGGDGKVLTATPFPVGQVEAMPAGGFVTAASDAGGPGFARFRADGSLDTSFGGGDGIVATSFPGTTGAVERRGVSPVPAGVAGLEGKVVAFGIGTSTNGKRALLLARFNADGSLDRTFGPGGADGDGRVTFVPPVPAFEWAAATVAPDTGKVVVFTRLAGDGFALSALNADGSPDTSFAPGGVISYAPPDPLADLHVTDVLAGRNGEVYVVGDVEQPHVSLGLQRDLFVFYFRPGSGYWVQTTDVYNGRSVPGDYERAVTNDRATAATLTPDGWLAVAAEVTGGEDPTAIAVYGGPAEPVMLEPWRGPDAPQRIDALGSDGVGHVIAAAGGTAGFHISAFYTYGPRDFAYLPPNEIDFATFGGNAQPTSVSAAAPFGKINVAGPVYFADAPNRPRLGVARFQGAPAGDAIEQRGDTLFIRGTDAPDTFRLEMGPLANGIRDLTVTYNGGVARHFNVHQFEPFNIDVDARGGDDSVLIDKSVITPAILRGGEGNDLLVGGSGRDEFFGGNGTDTVSYEDRDNDLFVSLDDVTNDGGRRDENVHSDVENVIGGSGNDVIVGSPKANRLEGRGGNDTISGGGGNDVLLGDYGDDTLNDASGTNTLDGGPGTDTINGIRETAGPVYQAEAARVSGAVVSASGGGYTGSGFVDFVNRSGDFVEWTVNYTVIGQHRLDFRYANGSSAARTMGVSIDGVAQPNIVFAPTGSWATWKVASVLSTLQAGAHQVRLYASGQSGPNVDSLAVTEPASAVSLEAEDAAHGGAVVSRSHPGYMGSGYLDFFTTENAFVEWTVDSPDGGVYAFDFRYANGGTSPRTQDFIVNGKFAGYAAFPGTGSWSAWRTQRMTWNLAKGRNTVRLRAGFAGPNIDSLSISEVSARQVREAESAPIAGAVVADSHPGFTGTGYVDFVARSGGYVEFVFDAPLLGEYSLGFRYANGGTADRPLGVDLDGVRLSDPVSFRPTGSWSSWATSFLVVRAAPGLHSVRLWTIGADGPNIDSVTVQ